MTLHGLDAVLFDFDFTLGDSSSAIIDCVTCALARIGLAPADPEQVRACIGLTLPEVLLRLSGAHEADVIERFVAEFHRRADEVMEPATVVFPGAVVMVTALRRAGLRTGIVSTKLRTRIEAILDRRGLAPLFDTVVGIEDVPASKPDPAGLLLALRQLDVEPARALYVGDHLVDAQAAARAGVRFVGVLTGMHTRACFDRIGAMCMADVGAVAACLPDRVPEPAPRQS